MIIHSTHQTTYADHHHLIGNIVSQKKSERLSRNRIVNKAERKKYYWADIATVCIGPPMVNIKVK